MVIRGVGIESSVTLNCFFKQSAFIDIKELEAVVINEGVKRLQIVFYLSFILKNKKTINKIIIRFLWVNNFYLYKI